MNPDPTLARIREARRRISQKCGHDPEKLVRYYMKLQEERYADRLVRSTASRPATEHDQRES